MEEFEKKESLWFKKIDLAFVYLFVFLAGIAIVMIITSYLNNKVKEFNDETMGVEIIK